MVRLVKGKFVAKVRMGGELGGPGGEAPGLGHSVQGGSGGLAPRFRPWHTKGGPGGLPPGLGQRVQGGSGRRSPPVYKCTAAQRGSGGLPPVW